MFVRVLAATAVLAFAGPAVAQQAPAAPPAAPAPADQPADASEAALEAKAEAFEARMKTMQEEMQAAVTAAGGDSAKATADLDAIEGRYQPEVDAFAAEVTAFISAQAAVAPEDQRAQMTAMLPMIEAQIKGVPAQIRAQAVTPPAAPAPAQ